MAVSTPNKKRKLSSPLSMTQKEYNDAKESLRMVASTMSMTLTNASTTMAEAKAQIDNTAQQMDEIVQFFAEASLDDSEA